MTFDGKRVLVTGAGGGIGRELVRHLSGLGAHVLATDVREEPLAESGAVATVVADVSSPADTHALAETAREQLGGLDALVANAAIVPSARRPFDEIAEDEWDRVLAVNVKGAWLCAKAVVPLLREAGGGSIVNLSSEVVWSGSSGIAHYVASKGAVIGLTRALARELGGEGIRVNALAPGFIATEAASALTGPEGYDASATALGRVGQPADLLGALTFLLSDESAFVTGQTLLVNGGRTFS